jgi:hypothetical protein
MMVNIPSNMPAQHNFSTTPEIRIERSAFKRSHGVKTTFNAGELVPIFIDEVLPGDTFFVDMAGFARLATPLHPFMDNMSMDTMFFAVPIRLLWEHWEEFNGEQKNPGDSTDYLVPQVTTPVGGFQEGSLYDYFGIPTKVNIGNVNNLFGRAYNMIWNEWFRDQNLQDSIVVDTGDGPDDPDDYVVKKRAKRHDYFTSCLPWPQKGDSVQMPLGVKAPVAVDSANLEQLGIYSTQNNAYHGLRYNTTPNKIGYTTADASNEGLAMYADLSEATAATVNQLREAFQIQRMFERDARGGTRYVEVIRAHFGVTSPDARMQRPEYLGGGSTEINVSAIPQTSSTDATSPQGNLAATGTAAYNGHGFSKSFTEHCVVIGLVNVRADLNYQQGIARMHRRRTRFDFFWPGLAHIGEQAVLNEEIYADGSANDEEVFGYQERYAEYRYKPSMVTGAMRSNAAQPLDTWHLAQDFASLPALNGSFIEEDPPVDRVIAVPSQPHFIFDGFISMKCVRPMPMYGQPGMIDHF